MSLFKSEINRINMPKCFHVKHEHKYNTCRCIKWLLSLITMMSLLIMTDGDFHVFYFQQVMTHTYVDLADELLCAGADPNVKDISHRHIGGTSTYRTICHDVAESGSLPTLQCLLRHGADISLRDKRGNTPAHVAAKSGHFKLVQYLLCGMATNVTNDLKRTPLDYLDSKEDPGCRQWVERRRCKLQRVVLIERKNNNQKQRIHINNSKKMNI